MNKQKTGCPQCGQNKCPNCGSWSDWRRFFSYLESLSVLLSFLMALGSVAAGVLTFYQKKKVIEVASTIGKMSVVLSRDHPGISAIDRERLQGYRHELLPYLPAQSQQEIRTLEYKIPEDNGGRR